jgi:hypothetical protein
MTESGVTGECREGKSAAPIYSSQVAGVDRLEYFCQQSGSAVILISAAQSIFGGDFFSHPATIFLNVVHTVLSIQFEK